MSRPEPQFRARLSFTFREHGKDRLRKFGFGEDAHRRVPMQMEGVDGLHTVGMWREGAGTFQKGDEIVVDCVVIYPEAFFAATQPGAKFELWDRGFFADGVVTTRFDDGWPADRRPPIIDGTRLIAWQPIGEKTPTGNGVHRASGEVISGQRWIAIATYDDGSDYYLFTGSDPSSTLTDTLHADTSSALEQADWEWLDLQKNWLVVDATDVERTAIIELGNGGNRCLAP